MTPVSSPQSQLKEPFAPDQLSESVPNLDSSELHLEYPEEDDQGMPEGDPQRDYIAYATKVLKYFFRRRRKVYVSGNLFLYYEQGNPSAVVAPDTFVVFGIDKHDRLSYKVWEENGKVPSFVLEIISKHTWMKDQTINVDIYARMGVKEYFQYDPSGQYIQPQLQGLRLVKGTYEPIPEQMVTGSIVTVPSQILALDLQLRPVGLRFYNPATNKLLLDYGELEEQVDDLEEQVDNLEEQVNQEVYARRAAEQQAEKERQRAEQLAARLRAAGIDPDSLE